MFSHQQLYRELGCLFYAVASESADGSLLVPDKETVEEIILFNWVNLEDHDHFNTDNAYRILFTFSDLDEGFTTHDEAYASFEKYFATHQEYFDPALRHKILTSARRIRQVIDKDGRQENKYLQNLQAMLEVKA